VSGFRGEFVVYDIISLNIGMGETKISWMPAVVHYQRQGGPRTLYAWTSNIVLKPAFTDMAFCHHSTTDF